MLQIKIHTAQFPASLEDAAGADAIVSEAAVDNLPIGESSLVDGVIHAPVMMHPDEPIPAKQVELACVAALRAADEAGYTRIAMPALGTGAGQVDKHDCARIMMETISMYMVDNQLEAVDLYSEDQAMLEAWQHHVIS